MGVPGLEATVQRVKEGSVGFARLTVDQRVSLLNELRRRLYAVAPELVAAACAAKGLDPSAPVAGDEWLGGPFAALIPRAAMRELGDGRLAVKVFPSSRARLDALVLPWTSGEVHLAAGITRENLVEHQARFYRSPHGGRLCAVLGAGNVNAIPLLDVNTKLFIDGCACVLKVNPVNAYVGSFIERAYAPAIERGYFAVTYGGAEEGAALVEHRLVDDVQITGSDKTHDLMVWGPPGSERAARIARGDPVLRKPIHSELGNVSPVIVVPGPYTAAELEFQAKQIAGGILYNASFNCLATKLIVTPKAWARAAELREGIARAIDALPARVPYYPGAEERWHRYSQGRSGLRLLGQARAGTLPVGLIPDVDATNTAEPLFRDEIWCSLYADTALSSKDAQGFFEEAVQFANERLWGTLCATIIVHPETMADPQFAASFERGLRALRYGAVCVNTWAGAAFGLGSLPWGGHPSSTLDNIQSGRGWVHNAFMLDEPEKSVLSAPLRAFPVWPWFPGHRTNDALGRALTAYELEPGWKRMAAVASAALRG